MKKVAAIILCLGLMGCSEVTNKQSADKTLPVRLPFTDTDSYYLSDPMPITRAKPTFIEPKFPGGDSALKQFIIDNTDPRIFVPDSCEYAYTVFEGSPYSITVYLLVDTSGKINYYKYPIRRKEPCGIELYDNNIKKMISKMPTWSPAVSIDTVNNVAHKIEYVSVIRVHYKYQHMKDHNN